MRWSSPPTDRSTGGFPSSCGGRSACGTRPPRRRRLRRGPARCRPARAWLGSSTAVAPDGLVRVRAMARAPPTPLRSGASRRGPARRCRRRRPRPERPGRPARRSAGPCRGRALRAPRVPSPPSAGRSLGPALAHTGCGGSPACSMPGSWMSAVYCASPRARWYPSCLGAGRPTVSRGPAGHCSSASSSTTTHCSV